MKTLFISGLYSQETMQEYNELAMGDIQNASNIFQWGVLEGLYNNNYDFDVVSFPFLPSFPHKYKQMFTKTGDITIDGNKVGKMLKYCNIYILKAFFIRYKLEKYITRWAKRNINEDKLVILVYSFYLPFIEAANAVKKKFSNIEIVPIIADLVDDMMILENNCNILRRLQINYVYKRTKELYKTIDKFVLLSKYMVDMIPEAKDKYVVLEGLCRVKPLKIAEKGNEKILFYAGTLQEYSCVGDLIDAFLKIKNPNYRLVICGHGYFASKIIEASKKDSRIIYKGLVSNDEVISMQQTSTALINPRKPNGHLTRYSFPSKTIECLSSGIPMIGYKLEGIPEEYYKHYYCIDDDL